MTRISFMVEGTPAAWARPQPGRAGRYTKPSHQAGLILVGNRASEAFRKAGQAPFDGPVILTAMFIFPWPKSFSEKRKRAGLGTLKTSAPDLSNLVKLIEDAMNGIAYRDDAQITDYGAISKRWGVCPGTYITVENVTNGFEADLTVEPVEAVR